jgi:putative transcriptional regulator
LKNNISALRKEKNISQKDLAKRVGVSFWWINHIESGKRNPSLALAKNIAETLNVKVSDLFLD